MGTSDAIGLIAGTIGIIVGLGGIVSVVLILARQKALELSLDLFQIANGELRSEVEAGRDERHTMRVDMEQKLADERAECSRSLGELQGQLTALTSGLGHDIATAVLSAFQQGQASNGGVKN